MAEEINSVMPPRNPNFNPRGRLERWMQYASGLQWFNLAKDEKEVNKIPATIVEPPKTPVLPVFTVDTNLFLKEKGYIAGDEVKLRIVATIKEDSDTNEGHYVTFLIKRIGVEG